MAVDTVDRPARKRLYTLQSYNKLQQGTRVKKESTNPWGGHPVFQRRMTIIVFPQELVEYILDFLQHDLRMLQKASLICHSWLLRCRSHMFRRMTMGYRHIPSHLTRLGIQCHDTVTKSSNLCLFVQELVISLALDSKDNLAPALRFVLPELPGQLVNLQKLKIVLHAHQRPSNPPLQELLSAAVTDIPRHPVFAILLGDTFASLKTLELQIVAGRQFRITMFIPQSQLRHFHGGMSPDNILRLQNLHLDDHILATAYPWLLDYVPRIDTSSCSSCSFAISSVYTHASERLAHFRSLMASMKASLQSLEVDFQLLFLNPDAEPYLQDFFINLSDLPVIKHLRLLNVGSVMEPGRWLSRWLGEASQVHSLETLEIHVMPLTERQRIAQRPFLSPYRVETFAGLDGVFSCNARFPSLRKFHVEFIFNHYPPPKAELMAGDACNELLLQFPVLIHKGIFSCSVPRQKCRKGRWCECGDHLLITPSSFG